MKGIALEQFEVLYDWVAEKEEDLPLFAGETIEVLEKHDHGWWLGIAQRDGMVYKGYFPKNYVKSRPKSVVAPPTPPPRPVPDAPQMQDIQRDLAATTIEESVPPPAARKSTKSMRRASFALKSTNAFDELSDRGFAVEVTTASSSSEKPSLGQRVEVQVQGLIWDGASTDTRQFDQGILLFTLGAKQVVLGLEQGIACLTKGSAATITCAPAMAYGSAGNPPFVPANAFIVFHAQLIDIHSMEVAAATAEGSMPACGPEGILIDSENAPSAARAAPQDGRRNSRLLLVPAGTPLPSTSTTTDGAAVTTAAGAEEGGVSSI